MNSSSSDTPTWYTPANLISLGRLFCVPVYATALVRYTDAPTDASLRVTALLLLILLGASDLIDGWLARRRNEVTRLGSLIDPAADKCLMVTSLLLLTRPSVPELQPQPPLLFTTLVFIREFMLIAGAFILKNSNDEVSICPTWAGKSANALHLLVIGAVLLPLQKFALFALVFVACVLTLWSAVEYLLEGISQWEKYEPGQHKHA